MSGFFECPVCGADVKRGALSCPECGACKDTGWKDDAESESFLPDEDFDYDSYVKKEFGNESNLPASNWVSGVAFFLVLVILLYWVL